MIKNIAISIIGYTTILALIALRYYEVGHSLSIIAGGTTMFLNILGLNFIWKQIFTKKSIALAIVAIIFKYLILGISLWSLSAIKWLNVSSFIIGMTALIFAILTEALKNSILKKTVKKN